jgi:hypothetical protein
MKFLGSARVSPKTSFPAKVRDCEDAIANTRDARALPGTDFVGKLTELTGKLPALPNQD